MKRGLNEVIAITTREEREKKCRNDNHSLCDSSRMYHVNRMIRRNVKNVTYQWRHAHSSDKYAQMRRKNTLNYARLH